MLHMRYITLLLVLGSIVPPSNSIGQEPSSGSIKGIVLESGGSPLKNGSVYALPEDAMNRPPIKSATNQDGQFTFESLPPGGYYLDASKDEDGYYYSIFSFYIMPGQNKPKVVVTANHPSANVVIQLGMKAAYLDLTIASDDGNDIKANVIFSRLDLPGTFRTSAAHHQKIPVPPVPFHIVVEAPGYEQWVYKGTNGSGLVNLRPSETLTVDVKLQRVAR
jgi:hypothetical protein